MKIYRIERGKYIGNLDIPKTIQTLGIGEIWRIEPFDNPKISSIRNACSLANRLGEKKFEVHCPAYSDPYISIIRTK